MRRIPRWLVVVFGVLALVLIVAALEWRLHGGPFAGDFAARVGGALVDVWNHEFLNLGDFRLSLSTILGTLGIIVVLWFGAKFAGRILRKTFLDKTHLNDGLKFSVQRVTGYVLFAVGALICLQKMGVNLTNLTVFSGTLGLGLGLGLQTIAKNFASGLVLLFEQAVKVGDRVQIEDLLGDIVHIGSRGTWVRTNDNVVMIVPNSEFVEGRVTNWTANDRSVRLTVALGVSYGSDPEQVQRVLMRVAAENPDVLEEPAPHVAFVGFGDSSLDFHLRVWTVYWVTRPRVLRSELYFATFAAFKAEGIEIPFPQRDLHLKTLPPSDSFPPHPGSRREDSSEQS